MLSANLNHRTDRESNRTILSSPPYTVMRELRAAGRRSNEGTRVVPTALSGQTQIRSVGWDGSFWQVVPGPVVGVAPDHRAVPDPKTPVVPDRSELQRRFGLTEREAEVALLLAERRTNKEIARALQVTTYTAMRHAEMVRAKLGISSRRNVLSAITGGPRPWEVSGRRRSA
jgi:DNA-binding CsgD family transcriptional regulator